jgi:hypothetical protein
VIPRRARGVSVDAGRTDGRWRLVGENGLAIGVDRIGASAPYPVIAEKFGLARNRTDLARPSCRSSVLPVMKNTTRLPKLRLHTQSLRILSSDEARRAAGGLNASHPSQITGYEDGACVAAAACAR